MEDLELIKKINKASNGDWKRKDFIKNCLNWVVENFDEVEPTIKRLWVDKEKAKLDKER